MKRKIRYYFLAILCVTMMIAPASVMASPPASPPSQGPWWDVVPEEENPSPDYDSILYSEIAPSLREIEVNSNRVKVEVIGQSAGGRNLFLVTLSAPEAMGRLGQYQAIRQTMLKDPEKAQDMIDKFGDFGLLTIPPILGVGLLSAVAFKDDKLAMSIPGTAGIPLSFLSGAFFPLPPKLILFGEVEIWHVNPLYSASEAIRKILFYEYTLSQVFMEITFLLTIGSLIFLIGAVLFVKRVYRLD